MKCYTPEIAWHNRDPILSVDIHPEPVSSNVYRLASAGSDRHLVIWHITLDAACDKGISNMNAVCDLTRHQKAVNIVRFSPSGEFLASGDDESVIFIWKQKASEEMEEKTKPMGELDEQWVNHKTLRYHHDDVYDICWSPDSTHIISGSVDNTAVLSDVNTGNTIVKLADHRGFVQGVTWDPCKKYVATLGCDRTLRVYSVATKTLVSKCSKAALPKCKETEKPIGRIFHDDTLKTYFRRLTFTPDGSLLIAPSGIIEPMSVPSDTTKVEVPMKPVNATYVFARNSFTEPVMFYPSGDQYSVAVRCCPLKFKKKNSSEGINIFNLPYRIVFAVATRRSVLLYDTEHSAPFGYATNIHYTRLTDLTWSNDGLILVVSSTDGFCTMITFLEGELGEKWTDSRADNNPDLVESKAEQIPVPGEA